MVELSLMASSAPSPGILHPKLAVRRPPKECQVFLPINGAKQYVLKSTSLHLNAQHLGDFDRSMHLHQGYGESYVSSSMTEKPVLIDVQDSRPDSVLFSFGIAEKCTQHDKILKFLTSMSNLAERGSIDVSLFSDLMGFHTMSIDMSPQPHFLMDHETGLYDFEMDHSHFHLHPEKQFYVPEPLMNFVGNMSPTSTFIVDPDGRLLFTGSGAEMRNLLSIVSEFNMPKRSTSGSKRSLLVPYFARKSRGPSRVNNSFHTHTVSPLKSFSPGSIELKPPHKKKQKKRSELERDPYQRNYFHAVESLLSIISNKNRGSEAIVSLKKSGTEIGQLLTQFSAGIAGTGLAVIFSVLCKLACGRAPFCSVKLLNTGVGLGLFWLSWAVNGLRDTILYISRNSNKLKLKEDEIAEKVERSMNQILLRAATLAAIAVLRLA